MIGFLCLVWLPFEDTNTTFTIGLAMLICAWLAVREVRKGKSYLARDLLIGAVTGIAIVPIALILMAIKSGLHAHGFSDFQIIQVKQVIAGFPFWILGGLLFGVIIGIGRNLSARANSEEN
ncbi:MAG: hypothetical protein JXB38_03515 [Anaerolineales bacterium]|nr:hypothetical protein [Anaerolineales bacterium]